MDTRMLTAESLFIDARARYYHTQMPRTRSNHPQRPQHPLQRPTKRCERWTLTAKTFSKSAVKLILEAGETTECPICFEEKISREKWSEEMVSDLLLIVPCGHTLCHVCLKGIRKSGETMQCPFCRGAMKGYVYWKEFRDWHWKQTREYGSKSPVRNFLKRITGHKDGGISSDAEASAESEGDGEDAEIFPKADHEGVDTLLRFRKWGTRFVGGWK
jgi:hypothetical protein